jgi:hypothetical protein
MKYYETHYEEYIHSVEQYNMHNELLPLYQNFPKKLCDFGNLIVFGPTGSGKYSQVLYFLKKYSPSKLKYDKKITCQTDKVNYIYHISDIHYEIDMSLLGCNSKTLWHEIFLQIVDIVSMKTEKTGIILCKNFHMIHNELLDIFYSYIQHYNHYTSPVQIRFILLSEHISFLPKNILNCFEHIGIKRPDKSKYIARVIDSDIRDEQNSNNKVEKFIQHVNPLVHEKKGEGRTLFFMSENEPIRSRRKNKIKMIMDCLDPAYIINIKETESFGIMNDGSQIPKDNFNTICNSIIQEMLQYKKLSFTQFRDTIYDILVYNLDVAECLWYVIYYFIQRKVLSREEILSIMEKTFTFLKYYNNNYRPIYHLESIFFYIITVIQKNQIK